MVKLLKIFRVAEVGGGEPNVFKETRAIMKAASHQKQ
jgi:hypothetical protein